MARYKIIKNIDKIYWDINCPVQIDKYNVLFDNTLQKNVLQLKLKNISDKFLQSVYMDIICYDDAKDILGSIKDISYTGLSVKAGESFGEKQPVATEYKDIGYIDIVITKTVFSDEGVWRNENNISLEPFECNSGVKEYYGELYGQYVRECNSTIAGTLYLYEDKGEYWICSCGQPNRNESQNCISCHAAKEKLNEISSKEYLAEKLDEYNKLQEEIRLKKEREEKEKAEQEEREARQREEKRIAKNKKIKKLSLISLSVLLVLVILGFSKNYYIKSSKYSNADTLLQNGNYTEAIFEFSELNEFKDSKDRVLECYYNNAVELENEKKYSEAIELFKKADNYKNAKEKYKAIFSELQKNTAELQNKISADSDHTVGLKSDGTVMATGDNFFGECDVSDWKNIVAISAGSVHTVGLKSDGTVVAAGENESGQCNVSGWKNIIAISAGGSHTVGLKSDGTVVAVGYNKYGQCNVSGWKNIVAVSASEDHTVGLKSDGTVVAVGSNRNGQCDVSDWKDIVAVSAGYHHTVGLKSDGTVVAVGYNDYGQCNVTGWKNIVAISASDYYTVGLKSDGTVVAVGSNRYGQCNVTGWKNIVAISASDYYTVGLKSDGTVVAVGDNKYGQCNVSDWKDIGVK